MIVLIRIGKEEGEAIVLTSGGREVVEEDDGKVRYLHVADAWGKVEVRKKGRYECDCSAHEVGKEVLTLVRKAEREVLVPCERGSVSRSYVDTLNEK